MQIALEIQRFNPETDSQPRLQTFNVTVEPTDRILDALMDISRYQDGTLVFRKSCAHGVCGSDAMRINGKERLACKTLVQDVAEAEGATVRIEPLRYLPVQRDLMVDQSVFFTKFRSVKPFLVPESEIEEKEYLQSQAERAVFDEATKCINCSACYSACPVLQKNPDFLGPAAIVQAARFVFDSRDKGLEARLGVLDDPNGVWPCENHFECTRVCPREIKITKLINLTKREIKKYREARGEQTAEPEGANQ
ncbi:MAG: succinate dehydrogenase iron-sulfur subunit [Spirochaetaceae bacterium]|nr:MAG: succinate dehydrogenase iron-sulfur subunit [Spirochaetaceae bacterium]